jgi:mono/diheme cytochrome c family protein
LTRDFQRCTYKFRTTATGDLPTIEDIERTVSRGVERSSMPAWSQFLTQQDIHDVSRYLVVFSEQFVEAWRAGERPSLLTISSRPPDLAALRSKGAELYKTLQCQACHGEQGRGDGPSAPTLRNDWDQAIEAADLTYKWSFRNGHEPEDIYRTMIGGLNGTPMPAYDSALPDEADRWALVAHILSLSPVERPALHVVDFAKQREQRIGPVGRVLPSVTQ